MNDHSGTPEARDGSSPPSPRLAAIDDQAWIGPKIAASMLGVSAVYVAMLCDAGELGVVVRDEKGRRLVKASAIKAYFARRKEANAGALSPREAATRAGMYERSDAEYLRVLRQSAKREGNVPRIRRATKASPTD